MHDYTLQLTSFFFRRKQSYYYNINIKLNCRNCALSPHSLLHCFKSLTTGPRCTYVLHYIVYTQIDISFVFTNWYLILIVVIYRILLDAPFGAHCTKRRNSNCYVE